MAGTLLKNGIELARSLSTQVPSVPFHNPYLERDVQRYFPTSQPTPVDDRPTWSMLDQLQAEREKDRDSYDRRLSQQANMLDQYERTLGEYRTSLAQQPYMQPTYSQGLSTMPTTNNTKVANNGTPLKGTKYAYPTDTSGYPDYIQTAMRLAPDLVYNLYKRGFGNFTDCSNFVGRSLVASGLQIDKNMNTASMPKELQRVGFKMLPLDPNDLQVGDIIWRGSNGNKYGHTAFYLGNGKTLEARNSTKGVGIFDYYKNMGTHVFRRI